MTEDTTAIDTKKLKARQSWLKWYAKNPNYMKEYRLKNLDKCREYCREYQKLNKNRWKKPKTTEQKEINSAKIKEKYATNPEFRERKKEINKEAYRRATPEQKEKRKEYACNHYKNIYFQ